MTEVVQDSLAHSPLLRTNAYIAGRWYASAEGDRFAVRNPATGAIIARVHNLGAADTRHAIEAAAEAWTAWRRTGARERARLLRRWQDLVLSHREELASIITAEQGKPLADARAEVTSGAAYLEWFAEEAKRVRGDILPTTEEDRRLLVVKQPIGVVAAITPWNFPIAMVLRKVAPALAAGCTVVLKPAEQTPLSALALAELAHRAGLPPGVLNIVTGDEQAAEDIGGELASHRLVRKLSFTGSTEIGRLLYRLGAGSIKKLSLELGGNAPFIVFADADLDAAVGQAMRARFRNAGQVCISANRFYIHTAIYDQFAERLANAVDALIVGNGCDPGVTQGPLIDARAIDRVERHVADAIGRGARVLRGGRRHRLGGSFFEPTVLVDVPHDALLAREETFGPVAPLFRFQDEAEAIAAANDTEYGLAAYCFTEDHRRIWRLMEALEFGIVGINTATTSSEIAPFGGLKQSGLGREGSHYGIDEYLEIKYACLGGLQD
jgi:succinate-semialdehyde dehydrogenase/glutarate-semialdehyde dehydrogenase